MAQHGNDVHIHDELATALHGGRIGSCGRVKGCFTYVKGKNANAHQMYDVYTFSFGA